jgi:thiol-disulfide isomerase/thioredoxin
MPEPGRGIGRRAAGAGRGVAGLIVLVVVLAAASAVGSVVRLRQGRFRARRSSPGVSRTGRADSGPEQRAAGPVLTAADLGASLGERATLVQFSTEFCAYCGPTRELLAEVARERARAGVAFVEVDAAQRLDLARRLNIRSTPTVLVLAADGSIALRASGQPRKSDVLAAVGGVLDRDGAP